MNIAATKLIAERSSAVAEPLQIVIAYDQTAMLRCARKLLNGFFMKWAADVEVHRDEWTFAELEHKQFRAEALELAAPASVLVIAVTGVNDLPLSVFEWLNDWIKMRNQTDTAVILAVGSSTTTKRELPLCASVVALPRTNGLSILSTTVNLDEPRERVPVNPASLVLRLGSICKDCLPEESGLND